MLGASSRSNSAPAAAARVSIAIRSASSGIDATNSRPNTIPRSDSLFFARVQLEYKYYSSRSGDKYVYSRFRARPTRKITPPGGLRGRAIPIPSLRLQNGVPSTENGGLFASQFSSQFLGRIILVYSLGSVVARCMLRAQGVGATRCNLPASKWSTAARWRRLPGLGPGLRWQWARWHVFIPPTTFSFSSTRAHPAQPSRRLGPVATCPLAAPAAPARSAGAQPPPPPPGCS
jgi:hypothetical protein